MGPEERQLIVYTGGTFDLLHEGHLNLLRQCRLLAGPKGRVVVSLNTDEFVAEYKGRPPVDNYFRRGMNLVHCRYVNSVVCNSGGADSKPAILRVNPDVIAIGTDWAEKDYYAQMGFTQDWLDAQGIVLAYLPRLPGISTSQLRG